MGVVSRRWEWVESMGVVSRKCMCLVGVVVGRYIDFLILPIPTPLVSALFLQQHPYFLFIFKMFFVHV